MIFCEDYVIELYKINNSFLMYTLILLYCMPREIVQDSKFP